MAFKMRNSALAATTKAAGTPASRRPRVQKDPPGSKKSRPNQPEKGHDYSKRPYRYDKSKGSYVDNFGDKAIFSEKSIDKDYRSLRKYEKRMRKAKAVAKRAAKGAGKIAGKALMGGIVDPTNTTSPRLSDRKQFKQKFNPNSKKIY